MQEGFVKRYKRTFYIEQLQAAGVNQIGDKSLGQATDRELKYALTIERAKQQ
ncbi:MAG: hypothetical protein ABS949_10150 [Solibacillus sp.]